MGSICLSPQGYVCVFFNFSICALKIFFLSFGCFWIFMKPRHGWWVSFFTGIQAKIEKCQYVTNFVGEISLYCAGRLTRGAPISFDWEQAPANWVFQMLNIKYEKYFHFGSSAIFSSQSLALIPFLESAGEEIKV